MNALPTREEFAARLETIFEMRTEADETFFELTLVEVKTVIANKIQECFSLLFRAATDAPHAQQLFRLKHEDLGEMELFLVPIKKNETGLYYEAVFNKLLA